MVSCTLRLWDGPPAESAAVMTIVWVPRGVAGVVGVLLGDCEELQAVIWKRLSARNNARSERRARPRRLRKKIRPRRLAQETVPTGSKNFRRLAELGAVVEITSNDVTGWPFSDRTVGGVNVQVSPARRGLQERFTVPLYP